MEKTIITSGKTIDLAIEAALTQLGLDRDSVSVQVLQQAKTGFLGFGAAPAKVQVTYEAPDPIPEAPKVALSAASRSKPKAAPAPAKKPEVVKPAVNKVEKAEAPKAETPKTEQPKAPKVEESKPQQPKQQKAPKEPREPKQQKAPKEPKVYAPAAEGSTEETIEKFLKGLLENMGSQAVPHAEGRGQHLPCGAGGRRPGLPHRSPRRDPGCHPASVQLCHQQGYLRPCPCKCGC